MMNQVHESAVVCLDIALARTHFLPFKPKFAKVERELSDLRELVMRVRILRNENADNAEGSGRFHCIT